MFQRLVEIPVKQVPKQLQAIRYKNQPYPIDNISSIEFLLPKADQWKLGLIGAKTKIRNSKLGLIGAKSQSEIKNKEVEKSVVVKEFICELCQR